MNDFYLTVPSNTRGYENTQNNFKVQLPKVLQLEGQWDVALVECQYRNAILNVKDRKIDGEILQDNQFIINWKLEEDGAMMDYPFLTSGIAKTTVTIPGGYYRTATDLCFALNIFSYEALEKDGLQMSSAKKHLTMTDSAGKVEHTQEIDQMELFIIEATRKVFGVKMPEKSKIVRIILSKALGYMLGFRTETEFMANKLAELPYDLRCGVDTMYCYCDIIEPQIVGNSMVPLLRTIPVTGDYGENVNLEWPNPHYVKVLSRNFQNIHFTINDHMDKPIPFAFGTVILKLHFKNASRVYSRFS